MTITFAPFNDIPCAWLTNGQVRLAVSTDRGPRVLSWGLEGGPNLFAELLDFVVDSPGGPFHFLGGHRLWHGPESLAVTYWPDDEPVQIRTTEQGAVFTPPPDGLGIVKEIEFALAADRPEVTVTHRLRRVAGSAIARFAALHGRCRRAGWAALSSCPNPTVQSTPPGCCPTASSSSGPTPTWPTRA